MPHRGWEPAPQAKHWTPTGSIEGLVLWGHESSSARSSCGQESEDPTLAEQGAALTLTLVSVAGTQVGKGLELSVWSGASEVFVTVTQPTIHGRPRGAEGPGWRKKALLRDLQPLSRSGLDTSSSSVPV